MHARSSPTGSEKNIFEFKFLDVKIFLSETLPSHAGFSGGLSGSND